MIATLLLAVLLGGDPSPAPAHQETGQAAAGHEASHDDPAAIVMHHVLDEQLGSYMVGALNFGATKHLLYLIGAGVLVLIAVRIAIRQYDTNGVPRGLAAAMESLLLFIRDEIAEKNIGHDGARFTPLLACFFFFILVSALVGLMPYQATGVGNVSVTLALAAVSFLATQWAGIRNYGVVKHFAGMVPPGLPKFLLPIMIVVELVGMLVRPAALTIRLFANMIAGHMVITTLLLLIPLMAKVHVFMGAAMVPVSLALAIFIMFLELLVAFLQAFIFTLLSSIFIGMAAHPAH